MQLSASSQVASAKLLKSIRFCNNALLELAIPTAFELNNQLIVLVRETRTDTLKLGYIHLQKGLQIASLEIKMPYYDLFAYTKSDSFVYVGTYTNHIFVYNLRKRALVGDFGLNLQKSSYSFRFCVMKQLEIATICADYPKSEAFRIHYLVSKSTRSVYYSSKLSFSAIFSIPEKYVIVSDETKGVILVYCMESEEWIRNISAPFGMERFELKASNLLNSHFVIGAERGLGDKYFFGWREDYVSKLNEAYQLELNEEIAKGNRIKLLDDTLIMVYSVGNSKGIPPVIIDPISRVYQMLEWSNNSEINVVQQGIILRSDERTTTLFKLTVI